jgi:hypothetical protein
MGVDWLRGANQQQQPGQQASGQVQQQVHQQQIQQGLGVQHQLNIMAQLMMQQESDRQQTAAQSKEKTKGP